MKKPLVHHLIDLGVEYATGRALVRVVSKPKEGQYRFSKKTGRYEFSASDTKRKLIINCAHRGTPPQYCWLPDKRMRSGRSPKKEKMNLGLTAQP